MGETAEVVARCTAFGACDPCFDGIAFAWVPRAFKQHACDYGKAHDNAPANCRCGKRQEAKINREWICPRLRRWEED